LGALRNSPTPPRFKEPPDFFDSDFDDHLPTADPRSIDLEALALENLL